MFCNILFLSVIVFCPLG